MRALKPKHRAADLGISRMPRCHHGQLAFRILSRASPDGLNRVRVAQDSRRDFIDLRTDRREPHQALALVPEQLDAELVGQRLELFADAGLGRVQRLRGRGHAEAVLDDLTHE